MDNSLFDKVASALPNLAEEMYKVASESIAEVSDQDILTNYYESLEAAGFDLEDPAVQKEVNDFLAANTSAPKDLAVEELLEVMSEDIEANHEKVAAAGGLTTGFATAQAAKAVDNFFNLHGAANLGSAFGMAPVAVGSAISPGDDSGISGGWGRLIGQNGVYSRAVSAAGKLSSIESNNFAANIKSASDLDELSDEDLAIVHLNGTIKTAADVEDQSVYDYLYDLGFEGIKDEIREELAKDPEMAKVINFSKEASEKTIYKYTGVSGASITDVKINEKVADHLVNESTFNWIDEIAKANEVSKDDLVIGIGYEKSANYLDELNEYLYELAEDGKTLNENGEIVELEDAEEKTAGMSDAIKKYMKKGGKTVEKAVDKGKKFVKKHKGAVAAGAGAAVAGGGLAAYLANKKKGEKEEKTASFETGESMVAKAREILKLKN